MGLLVNAAALSWLQGLRCSVAAAGSALQRSSCRELVISCCQVPALFPATHGLCVLIPSSPLCLWGICWPGPALLLLGSLPVSPLGRDREPGWTWS